MIDDRIARLWKGHPHLYSIPPAETFLQKATQVIEALREQVPECCRHHIVPLSKLA